MRDDGDDPHTVGVHLAGLHARGASAWPSMHEYVERPQVDDGWTLRSALVRYAQPEPVRAAAVLELVRRAESGYADHARLIERSCRVSDLARAHRRFGDDGFAALLDAYLVDADPLTDEEQAVIGVLSVAAELDELGGVVARWAIDPSQPRPNEQVDRTCRRVHRRLDTLGVERRDWYR